MARGDVLLVGLPPTGTREQSGRRPAVAVQTDIQGDLNLHLHSDSGVSEVQVQKTRLNPL